MVKFKSCLAAIIILGCLITNGPVVAQVISGTVLDQSTQEPLTAVSIYYDGSTRGTITDENGKFRLTAPQNSLAALIISHLGYETRKIDPPFSSGNQIIYLRESIEQLPEVVVTSDPFSRRQKLQVFRKEFLGDGRAARNSKILNEDNILLYFNSFDTTLTATARASIVIVNSFLNYKVRFDLKEFVIAFRSKSLERIGNIKYTRYAGFSRFEDFADNERKVLKRRKEAYLGSSMHFMQSLWAGNLAEENYVFNSELKPIPPDQLFHRLDNDSDGFKTYELSKDRFVIFFKNKSFYRSTVVLDGIRSISIDRFGNYTPYQNLIFGGYMAELRVSEMLPLEYAFVPAPRN